MSKSSGAPPVAQVSRGALDSLDALNDHVNKLSEAAHAIAEDRRTRCGSLPAAKCAVDLDAAGRTLAAVVALDAADAATAAAGRGLVAELNARADRVKRMADQIAKAREAIAAAEQHERAAATEIAPASEAQPRAAGSAGSTTAPFRLLARLPSATVR